MPADPESALEQEDSPGPREGERSLMLFQQQIPLGLPLDAVQEVLTPARTLITPIPNTLAGVRGILNLRGQLLLVLDLGYLLSRTYNPGLPPNQVIVIRSQPGFFSDSRPPDRLGLLVERVHQVVNFPSEHMDSAPDFRSIPAALRARLSPLVITSAYWEDRPWQLLSVPALMTSSLWM